MRERGRPGTEATYIDTLLLLIVCTHCCFVLYVYMYTCSIFPNVGEYVFDPKAHTKMAAAAPGPKPLTTGLFDKSALEMDVSFVYLQQQ